LASDGHRPHDEPARGLSPRAILLAIAAVLLTNWWMYHSELVTGRYVTQGIPPLPALIVLILGVALRPLAVRAAPRLALSRAELLTVFVFLTIAVPITASYGVRAFLPHLTMPRYRQAAENEFERINQMIPAWYGPTDPETVRQVYEGAEAGAGVPWGEWTGPLALWTVFLLACFVGALSLVSLLHREWSEGEKLLYPLTFIPLEMTRSPLPGARSLLADPLTWVGIGVSCVFNGWNILGAFNPSVPSPGFYKDVSELLSEQPWAYLRPVTLYFRPDIVGVGYLIPADILLSSWMLFALWRVGKMVALTLGDRPAEYPYPQEAATGGYLAMALMLLWSGRRGLAQGVHALLGRPVAAERHAGPIRPRLAAIGLIVSGVLFVLWCVLSGLTPLISLPYLIALGSFTLVFVRFRAETGMPIEFLYPYGYARKLLLYSVGTTGLLRVGGPRGLTILTCLAWLARHHLVPSAAAYSVDAFRISDGLGLRARKVVPLLVLAFVVGLAAAYVTHLTAYYTFGQNVLEGRTFEADYRAQVALQEFVDLEAMLRNPTPASVPATLFTGYGFLAVMALSLLRRAFMRFPLHPLGFLIAVCYGHDNPWWSALFAAWAAKAALMRIGGLSLYRRLVPLFIGLFLGHLFAGGVVWTTLSVFVDYTISARYHMYFG